uniref:Uncharacterized protein n=1 Tax=Microviridae sp. ctCoW18 TaxID=2826730 RepID=A0A8S5NRS2_9VIRU|nr:MAG TPA: hypothetical protein [Microviridae sp. ctCoW18]
MSEAALRAGAVGDIENTAACGYLRLFQVHSSAFSEIDSLAYRSAMQNR